MNTNNPLMAPEPVPKTGSRSFLASWYAPAALGLLLLVGLAVWARPVRIERAVTDAYGKTRILTAWDTSNLQAVAAYWWQALLLALAFVAIVGVTWHWRSWVAARASAARFFAASLLIHCMLVLSLGTVPLARAVALQAESIRVSQAAQLFEEGPASGGGAGERAAYEKVADPPAENVVTPQLVRQPTAAVPMPDAADALVPTIPMQAARSLPPERLLFVPARQPEVARQPLEIQRRGAPGVLKPAEIPLEKAELPPPESAPRERPLAGRPVQLARQEPAAPASGGTETLALPEMKRPNPATVRPAAGEQPRMNEPERPPAALTGRRQPGPLALAAPAEPATALKAESPPVDRVPGDVRVTVSRTVPSPLPIQMPEEKASPALPPRQPVRASIPSPAAADVKPTLGPAKDRLARTPPRISLAIPAEDIAPAPVPLVLRQKEERQRSVEQYGGTKASEAAVERGLDWLAAHQNADGSWSLHNHHANCKHPLCGDPGTVVSDPASTGMVLLPFLAAGHTEHEGKHRLTVTRALHWLVSHQQPTGSWTAPQDARPMYGHAMATIALCEAYGMTQSAKLRLPAQKALDYIVRAQHPGTGGWRYQPNQPADTSVVGWQMMALKSGEMAGLSVPPKTFEGIKRWLSSVEMKSPGAGGRFGYQSATPTPAMTAQGLLCLQYLGARQDDPRMRAGTDYLRKHLPRPGAETSYYWYHATQVMFHTQGEGWKAWNGALRDMLVSTQETRGALAGSWRPADARERPGGRLYATALRLLMLEVYYRHLPLYQQLQR